MERIAFEFRSGVGVEPRVAGLRTGRVDHERKRRLEESGHCGAVLLHGVRGVLLALGHRSVLLGL